jgi:uncharacterized membrane protein
VDESFWQQNGDLISALVTMAVAFAVAFAVDRLVIARGGRVAGRVTEVRVSRAAQTRLRLVRRLVFVAILLIGAALALSNFTKIQRLATGILASSAVLGLVIGFAGVGLLVAPGGAGGAGSRAAFVLVFSSLAWAIGSLYSRRAPQPQRPLVSAAMQMLAGGLMLTVVAAVSGELGRVHPSAISLESWLGLAYLVGVGSLLGFTAYMWLLRVAPTSLVGTYAYVNPVVAVLLGTLVLGESLTWRTLVGGGIIVASVALIVRAPKRSPRGFVEPRPAAVAVRGR